MPEVFTMLRLQTHMQYSIFRTLRVLVELGWLLPSLCFISLYILLFADGFFNTLAILTVNCYILVLCLFACVKHCVCYSTRGKKKPTQKHTKKRLMELEQAKLT